MLARPQNLRPAEPVLSQPASRRGLQRPSRDDDRVGSFTPGRIPSLLRKPAFERLHRAVDILGALVGLLLFAPAMLIAAIAIKSESKGPILYSQTRVGSGGRLFRIYKLRTMGLDADARRAALESQNEQNGPAFKMKNDPRVTTVGRILRRYSLDEVPQFFNVLKGDMSLVGPRPPLASEVECYKRWQLQRLMVKPGLTGLWQVSGRNQLSFDEWVRLDIRYIKRRSLAFDLWIMVLTLKVIFVKPDGL